MGYWQMVGIVGVLCGILMTIMILAIQWLLKNDG